MKITDPERKTSNIVNVMVMDSGQEIYLGERDMKDLGILGKA